MPITKAAKKHLKQSARQRKKNLQVKTAIRKNIKALRKTAGQKDPNKAAELLRSLVKQLDTAAGNRILKKNTTSRLKSRLTKLVNKIGKG